MDTLVRQTEFAQVNVRAVMLLAWGVALRQCLLWPLTQHIPADIDDEEVRHAEAVAEYRS